jgi:hypothetical protein
MSETCPQILCILILFSNAWDQWHIELAFPSHSKLHHVFHVSFLKKVIGTKCHTQTSLPELDEEGSIWLQPQAILDQRERRLHQHTIKEVLVQWKDTPLEYATWESNYHSTTISSS